jgi:hypothetical protein
MTSGRNLVGCEDVDEIVVEEQCLRLLEDSDCWFRFQCENRHEVSLACLARLTTWRQEVETYLRTSSRKPATSSPRFRRNHDLRYGDQNDRVRRPAEEIFLNSLYCIVACTVHGAMSSELLVGMRSSSTSLV